MNPGQERIDGSDFEEPMEVEVPVSALRKRDVDKLWNFLMYGCPRTTVHIPQNRDLEDKVVDVILRLIALGAGETVIDGIRKAATGHGKRDDSDHTLDDSPATCLKYPVLYALAVCIKSNNPATKKKAYDCLLEVCTIPSYLFLFLFLYYRMCLNEAAQISEHPKKPSWPKSFRKTIKKWYTQFDPLKLAHLVTKYRSRYGWSHKKVLRLAHIGHDRVDSRGRGFVIKYILSGLLEAKNTYDQDPDPKVTEVREYLEAVEYVRRFDYRKEEDGSEGLKTLLEKIKINELAWEHVQTYVLKSPLIWRTLLVTMPPLALIRNLSRLSYLGLLTPGSNEPTIEERIVCERLQKRDALLAAKIHPMTILIAISRYTTGQNQRNKRWSINEAVRRCLWAAFCTSYEMFHPTGKNLLVALNINTRMLCPVIASPALSSKMAAVAIAKIFHEVEGNQRVNCIKFDSSSEAVDMTRDVVTITETFPRVEGQTDFTVPFTYARNGGLNVDAFVILSDFVNDDQIGKLRRGLSDYCAQHVGRRIKLVIIGLTSTELSEVDPEGEENLLVVPGIDINSLRKVTDFIALELDNENALYQMLQSLNIVTR
ncbi:hypothetical protein FSP39_012112 [Pinctada imbricata]|uniref:TROVE domain-containing protein n=1 Tax=Pinctada imbricata TaxID=66713 RepID=A0AA88YNW9_PINIB|nr:hypothetical protein FSP39_012112 [Pinctada imbricata]